MKINSLKLSAFFILTILISCKKEKNATPTSNPNIKSTSLAIKVDGKLMDVDTNIDLNNDSYYDFKAYSSHPGGNPNASQIGINSYSTGNYSIEFLVHTQGIINEMWMPLAANKSIESSLGTWSKDAIIYYNDLGGSVGKLGVNDMGDVYFAYRFRNILDSFTKYYYGYIIAEVSSNHVLKIKEVTHQLQANVSIKTGEK